MAPNPEVGLKPRRLDGTNLSESRRLRTPHIAVHPHQERCRYAPSSPAPYNNRRPSSRASKHHWLRTGSASVEPARITCTPAHGRTRLMPRRSAPKGQRPAAAAVASRQAHGRRDVRRADSAPYRTSDAVYPPVCALPCVGQRSRTPATRVGPRPRRVPACERGPEAAPDPAAGTPVVSRSFPHGGPRP
jgi:hypothetical protein